MKQEIISYLSTIKEDIFNISRFIYDNPEDGFNEYKSCRYLINFLKEKGFSLEENYLNIPAAFMASFGEGHPKICYICEYDADPILGHITGNNLLSAMSVGAGLALKKVISNLNGTVIIIGCPGKLMNDSKVIMAKQGAFEDLDAVLMVRPHIQTAQSANSNAMLPVKLIFKPSETDIIQHGSKYTPYDACVLTFNGITFIANGFKGNCAIDDIIMKNSGECQLNIKAPSMEIAFTIEEKIKTLTEAISSIMGLNFQMSLSKLPCEEFASNEVLSRLFSHNLKENGIVDINVPKASIIGLSLGCISHTVPTAQPLINITSDISIQYMTSDFAKATLSDFAMEQAMKAIYALAFTGLDLIEKKDLISDAKNAIPKGA